MTLDLIAHIDTGHLSATHAVPSYNILLIGVLTLVGANILTFDRCAHLINFGAFLAFMLVNAAAMKEYFLKPKEKTVGTFFLHGLPPAIGIVACFGIWQSLPAETFLVGGSWLALGILYLAIRTRGFRVRLEVKDVF